MQIVPRDYQIEAADSPFHYFQNYSGNPIIAMPGGSGKSVVIAMFLEKVYRYYLNQKILVVTHVKELIEQNYDKLIKLWPTAPAGINSESLGKRDVHDKIIFCGIASIFRRAAEFGHVDLILVDEAHLVGPKESSMYQVLFNALKEINPCLKVIGFTATPWRLSQGSLVGDGSLFNDICFDITGMSAFNRLIDEGYLCPLIPKRTHTQIDVSKVEMQNGDYNLKQLQEASNIDRITVAALEECRYIAQDRNRWLLFAAGIDHSNRIAEILNYMGISCHSIHSKMKGAERDAKLQDFRDLRVRAVVNNNILTTGTDIPGIDFIGMLRATQSPILWVQMLSRGTRICPWENKVNCLVGDFAGNTKRLGPINDPVVPRAKGKSKGGGTAPVKECDNCMTYNHASVRLCVNCGQEFAKSVNISTSAGTDELIKREEVIVEIFAIDHITFDMHQKDGKPPGVKICYFSGLRRFNEFLLFEHGGYAQRRAAQWWARAAKPEQWTSYPKTTQEALDRLQELNLPTHIKVHTNTKYPEILEYDFSGSQFGAQKVGEAYEPPTAQILDSKKKKSKIKSAEAFDDDIPF